MALRFITADFIFPGDGRCLENYTLVIDGGGTVQGVIPRDLEHETKTEVYKGGLCPGFINTHCHLELSHLLGKIETGTKLLPFLQAVVSMREFPQSIIDEAIVRADQEMQNEGIVAVGDICNTLHTYLVKEQSPIRYYSFVEMFDFLQSTLTENEFHKYKAVYDAQSRSKGNSVSAVPHAPYTVSEGLFKKINDLNAEGDVVSIHNQETSEEDMLFRAKKGGFLSFFQSFGINLDSFDPIGATSPHYTCTHLKPKSNVLFVHNTLTSTSDIDFVHHWSDKVYWATCPNANLYIENRLPNYRDFIETGANMTVGTDSLSSNWRLSILNEIQTIQKYQSYLDTTELLVWATSNGAKALNMQDELGSFETGKKPGVLLLEGLGRDLKLQNVNKIRRID